ncbi:MAG: hypothetical protein ABFR19_01670 [Pseudomonadota bacterium]
MCKLCWGLLLVLLMFVAAGAYQFIIQGKVAPSRDARTAIVLSDGERDLVLTEMRDFLLSLQQITRAAVVDDMEAVAAAAKRVGRAAQDGVPLSLISKLPVGFKQLGFETHGKFDRLALDAEQLGDRDHILEQTAVLMDNCIGCHAAFKLVAEQSN